MSCKNPVPSLLANPVLHAKSVQDLQILMQSELSWIENIYAIARIGITKTQSGTVSYPQVYSGTNSKYYDIRPDSSLRAYSFFEVNNSFPVDKDQGEIIYNLSLICWYNMPKLNGEKSYDYSPELLADVLRVIRESNYNDKISNLIADVNPEDIFNKYSLSQEDTQYLMYPYGAFKLTFDYTDIVEVACFDTFATGGEGCGIFTDGGGFSSGFSDGFEI